MPPRSAASPGCELAVALDVPGFRSLEAHMANPDSVAHLAVVPDRQGGRRTAVPLHLLRNAEFRLPDLGRRMTMEIRQQMAVYRIESAIASREDLTRSVTANLQTVIDALRTPDSVDMTRAFATGIGVRGRVSHCPRCSAHSGSAFLRCGMSSSMWSRWPASMNARPWPT